MPENSLIMCAPLFEVFGTAHRCGHHLKTTSGPAVLGKTGPQRLKAMTFFSCHMKVNFEAIHFHIKSRGVQSLVFVQTAFENRTLNFGIKKTSANFQSLLA